MELKKGQCTPEDYALIQTSAKKKALFDCAKHYYSH